MRKREQAQMRIWEETAAYCSALFPTYPQEGAERSYLASKGLTAPYEARFGTTAKGTFLLVPYMDLDRKLWGWQTIGPDGQKRYYPGAKKRGNFCVIPSLSAILDAKPDRVFLAEGFTTASSVYLATGKPVIVAFDSGNISPVLEAIRSRLSDIPITICGDDDRFLPEKGIENAGRIKGTEAAKKFLCSLVFPEFNPQNQKENLTDFNDLHQREGLDTVKAQILKTKATRNYIRPLGYNEDIYYYTSSQNKQITKIDSHSSDNLFKLMSVEYWESMYPGKQGVDWNYAKSELMAACRRKGFFLDKNVRGIGVWLDEHLGEDRLVINLGDRIHYDGQERDSHDIESRYFYTVGERFSSIPPDYLSTDECKPIRDFIKGVSIKEEQQRIYLGGWIVASILSGVLKWRPHLWLTGESNSGKSTVMRDFISKLQHGLVRRVGKGTTEAGARQIVKHDAVPVMYDEFEPKDYGTLQLVKQCLQFICQASTDDSGDIVKGSVNGAPMFFTPRFSALVSSIRPISMSHEEQNRFSFVEFDKKKNNPTQWKETKKALDYLTPEYCSRFVSRVIKLYPIICMNEKIFRQELSKRYDARTGQQYGVLLAGWCSLHTDKEIDQDAASEFIDRLTFNFKIVDHENDEESCIDYLLQRRIKVGSLADMTVYDAVEHWDSEGSWAYQSALGIYGICVVRDRGGMRRLFIPMENAELKTLFRDSPWQGGWKHSLARLPGAISNQVARPPGQKVCKGVKIPMTLLANSSPLESQTD